MKHKRILLWPIKIMVTLLFLYVANKSLTGNDITLLIHKVKHWPVLATILLSLAATLLHTLRWHIILRHFGFVASFTASLKTVLWGNTLAFITPGRIGELFRGLEIDVKRKGDSIIAALVDKIYVSGSILVVGMLGFGLHILIFGSHPYRNHTAVAAVTGTVILFAAILFLHHRPSKQRPAWLKQLLKAWDYFPDIYGKEGNAALGCSLAAQLILIVQTVIVFDMFGSFAPVALLVIASQAYVVMTLIPIAIANMGIREFSFALFAGQFFLAGPNALSLHNVCLGASVSILLINILLPAFAGLLWELIDNQFKKG
ncbi:MAG: hypothetical protein GF398_18435 [Chitinivibrionales bacterium]|nr:hypothetical protein [Chitinivibrionales bacterium]